MVQLCSSCWKALEEVSRQSCIYAARVILNYVVCYLSTSRALITAIWKIKSKRYVHCCIGIDLCSIGSDTLIQDCRWKSSSIYLGWETPADFKIYWHCGRYRRKKSPNFMSFTKEPCDSDLVWLTVVHWSWIFPLFTFSDLSKYLETFLRLIHPPSWCWQRQSLFLEPKV